MRRLSIVAWMGVVLLAGCGGSRTSITGAGTGSGTTTTTDPVTSVVVTTNAQTIASDGSTSATISAYAKDANNNFVTGATVVFTASAGGLTVTQATTDATGLATATLAAQTVAVGTAITVTATTEGVKGSVTVTVANTQESISVITSLPQIPSDGSKSATITALVRNAQNQFVTGVPVTFTASSGGLTVTQGTTDTNGAATAMLSSAGDPTNRTITVTATAASGTATVPVTVVGTKLTVTGPTNLVLSSQGTYTVALTDAGGNGIANQSVTLASADGNTLSSTSVTTDSTGQKTFTLIAVNGGTDTLTATALGLQATQSVVVSTQSFAFTVPAANALVNIGTAAPLTVVWTSAGVAQAGQTVNFSATRGTLSANSATIGSSGSASVTISSTTAGPSVISATGNGVTAQVTINFVATTPTAVAVQASPPTIVTQGQSTITATVRDANNNLVQGQVVDFSITQDSTGGSLSVASATTDAQGQASTVYTASTTTSASNGIIVSATVQGTAVTGSASLTVGGQTVFLSLGTGNLINAFSTTQYGLPYSVQAVDSAGNGVNNVAVNFTVTSLGYIKGQRAWNGTTWITVFNTVASDPYAYILNNIDGCRTEDVNGNGVLDPGEDYNLNGKLDPGLVVSTDVGSATTSNGGSATVNLIYPKDHAYYVAVELTATATVTGTQSSTSAVFWLPGLAADFNSQTVSPPGPTSPYGTAATCGNAN
jgi:Bacterial Ig-like domain (group 1)